MGGVVRMIEFETKTFTVSDSRTNPYKHNQGISICAGNGDGLYGMFKEELLELRDVVSLILGALESEEVED